MQNSQIIVTLVVNLIRSCFSEVYLLLLTQSLVRLSRHTHTEMQRIGQNTGKLLIVA